MPRKRFNKRNINQRDDTNERNDKVNIRQPSLPYKDIVKINDEFETFYKMQRIVAEEDWETFMQTVRRCLPTAFRINGFRGQAKALLRIIQGQHFENLLNVTLDDEKIEKPQSLPWYPDNLAWQLQLSRVMIRKSEEFAKLHNFLVSETESGNISRQETVSMIPPLLMDLQPHHKVLDMCASPGSKTAQMIEMLHRDENKLPTGVVVANDVDNKRCYMLVHQAKRLHSPCFVVTNHDASHMPNIRVNKNGEEMIMKFDRVLCDVPCSGDGTIRKNVDVWTKWNSAKGNNLHGLQFRIVRRGLEMLVEGGKLVYSTCSFNPIENEAVIASILQQSKGTVELLDASESLPGLKYSPGLNTWKVTNRKLDVFTSFKEVPKEYHTQIRPQMFPPSPEVVESLHLPKCIRILPHQQDTGAFFVAVLRKKTKVLPWEDQVESKPKPIADELSVESKEQNSDTNGKEDQSTRSPPRKKKKHFGFREDPYVFFNDDEDAWLDIKNFYRLKATFPHKQLLTRCHAGRKRNLYFVSEAAKAIVESNTNRIKIINTGVRVMCRSENRDASCGFRLAQEGIPHVLPFMENRILEISKDDLLRVLNEECPIIEGFSEQVKSSVSEMDAGCVALVYTVNKCSDDELKVVLCGWRGRNSLRCYVPKSERIHYLRIAGVDVSGLEKREKKFKSKEEADNKLEQDVKENDATSR